VEEGGEGRKRGRRRRWDFAPAGDILSKHSDSSLLTTCSNLIHLPNLDFKDKCGRLMCTHKTLLSNLNLNM
jgi:hypothetical protein